jgi:hypothetical protein
MTKKWASILGATVIIVALIYGLNRGIYFGSISFTDQGLIHKNCRYLFITGFSESPALGAALERFGIFQGVRLATEPDNLYCKIFRD